MRVDRAAAWRRRAAAPGRVLVVVDLRHRREQLGVEDDADLAADVVEHAVGVHGAVALAEDDVAFHVDFQRHVALLRELRRAARVDADAPDDGAVGFDIDVAERAERFGQAFDGQPLDDDVHAAVDDGDVFAGGRLGRYRSSGPTPSRAGRSACGGSWPAGGGAGTSGAGGGTVCGYGRRRRRRIGPAGRRGRLWGRRVTVGSDGGELRRRRLWRDCKMQIAKCKLQIGGSAQCADAAAQRGGAGRRGCAACGSMLVLNAKIRPASLPDEKCAHGARVTRAVSARTGRPLD